MTIGGFQHINIRSTDVERSRDFYVRVIGLRVGDRPPFSFSGYWLYLGDEAVVHLVQRGPDETASPGSGNLDHVAFRGVDLDGENPKPPVTVEQRGRILGIGGVFFKSANRDQMREWYSTHLGLADKGGGAMLPWREHDDPRKEHVTVWTVFPSSTDYFNPSQSFMINYIVDDLDALLDRLKQEGVRIDSKRMNESYGRFAWIYDLDGNKIELWQPLSAQP